MSDTVASLRLKVYSDDVVTGKNRLEQLERQAKGADTAVTKFGLSSKLSLGAILSGVGSMTAISAATGAAVAKWLDYDKAMKEVLSITTLSKESFGDLREDVLNLATSVGVDATVAAKGLYEALSAGIPQDNILEFMKVASKAAIAGVTEVNVAVDGLTNVINSYHLAATDAERVSDQMFAAVVDGKTTFEELAAHMSKASVIAASLDVPFEELLASIISITKQGTQTSEAFTQMKAVFTALVRPTDELQTAYDKLEIKSGRQAIAQYGLAGALQLVSEQFIGNDAGLVKALGSTEAYNGVLSVTGANLKTFELGLKNVNEAAGKTNKAYEDNANTLSIALTSLKNTFSQLVESMEHNFGIIQGASDLLKEFTHNVQLAKDAQNAAVTASQNIGGIVGVQTLQDEIAKLEALDALLKARQSRGAFTSGLGESSGGFGKDDSLFAGAKLLSTAMEETETKLRRARAELAKYNEETVKSANLQRALSDAVSSGNAEAEAAIRSKIQAQEAEVAQQREFAEIDKEVSELELLLKGKKLEAADEVLAKEKETSKVKEKAAKDEQAAIKASLESARELTTTEKEKLQLKIKQLEIAKAQVPEEAALADKAIAALRLQIVEYDKLQEKKQIAALAASSNRSGIGKGFSTLPGVPIIGDALLAEEGLIDDSYQRRQDKILDSTRETAQMQADIMVDAQAEAARQMEEAMIGHQRFELNAYSEFFGNIANLSNFHSEKAFRVAQIASIAQATIKMYESAVAAYASGAAISPFLGPVFAGAALAAGAANIANIKAQRFQAYEHGGMIPSGGLGLVGEAGPEFVRGPAIVTSAKATDGLRRSGSDSSVKVVINNAPGHVAEVTETENQDGKMIEITITKTIDRLVREAQTGGGRFVPALASKYNLQRNGNAK